MLPNILFVCIKVVCSNEYESYLTKGEKKGREEWYKHNKAKAKYVDCSISVFGLCFFMGKSIVRCRSPP